MLKTIYQILDKNLVHHKFVIIIEDVSLNLPEKY